MKGERRGVGAYVICSDLRHRLMSKLIPQRRPGKEVNQSDPGPSQNLYSCPILPQKNLEYLQNSISYSGTLLWNILLAES